MVNLPIERRLIHYFLAMGAEQIIPKEATSERSFTFKLGNEKLVANVLTAEDLMQRNRILETLIHISSNHTTDTQVYVVAPRLLGATIDAQIFRTQGIGLLLFDDRRIEETIKPQPRKQNEQLTATPTAIPDASILSELATLRSTCSQLERALEVIRVEFDNFKVTPPTKIQHSVNESKPSIILEPTIQPTTISTEPIHEGPLPSFFANNPWLDVLSRRGAPEVATYA